MADGIVDNAPEVDLTNAAEFEATIAEIKAEKPETPDVKPKESAASSAGDKAIEVPTEESGVEEEHEADGADETPDKMKARIRGLQAELTRRKGNAEKVGSLEVQLAKVQGQLEQLNKPAQTATTSLEDSIRKLDDRALIGKQTDWDDELADARARYAQAEDRGDEKQQDRHAERIKYAKQVLSALRTESLERIDRKQTEGESARAQQTQIKTELDAMYASMTDSFPDFQDKESAMWKAGNEEYNSHPEIMKRLGPAGEIVAAALAVIKNPNLAGKQDASVARRDLVKNLEKGVKKAFQAGGTSPTTSKAVNYSVNSGEGLAKFNELIDRIKGG